MKKKDIYTILDISEKSRSEFQIGYAVESEDIPRFKAMVSVPAGKPKEDIIERVNDAAHHQLEIRREKIAKEAHDKEERENIERLRDSLKADIDGLKGAGIQITKPKEKKARLETPPT
jgi:phosphoglycolate phosphatase-like HAD superfamily hydrolase